MEQGLRPITLTSHLTKIMECFTLTLPLKQVRDKLDINQFALVGKSTNHALIYFLHVFLHALDQGDAYVRVFFADFSKGFNLVDHSILIQQMQLLGVHKAFIRWISSFLSGRVRVEGIYSNRISPHGGIPQGTKLAPLLFAILVNNLCKGWCNRLKYVDNSSVFEIIPRCSPSYLPFIGAAINRYAMEHNLKLNENKCK